MSTSQMLADVAAAAAAVATPAAPAAAAPTTPSANAPEAPAPQPAASSAPEQPSVAAPAFTPRVALEMTALAFPAMAGALTKLAIAADGGEGAFRSALLAERSGGDGGTAPVSTAQTATAVKQPGSRASEGRGAGLKAAAQALNSK